MCIWRRRKNFDYLGDLAKKTDDGKLAVCLLVI